MPPCFVYKNLEASEKESLTQSKFINKQMGGKLGKSVETKSKFMASKEMNRFGVK
jgi:hypothetical protein